jgi:hypothetical protein
MTNYSAKRCSEWKGTMRLAVLIVLVLCFASATLGKEAGPTQTGSSDSSAKQPIGGGRPVKTTTIRRCPDGYELVTRVNGQRGCARDILPPNE